MSDVSEDVSEETEEVVRDRRGGGQEDAADAEEVALPDSGVGSLPNCDRLQVGMVTVEWRSEDRSFCAAKDITDVA